jgi:hypothetical protein
MWWSGQIGPSEWAAHFFAGVIASGVVVFWDKQIRHWFNDRSKTSRDQDLEIQSSRLLETGTKTEVRNVLPSAMVTLPKRPQTAPPGGRRPENQDCSLSISFAKPGIYY